MRLYLYDHCPYCIRVLLGARLKALPVELIYLPYDDAATPLRLIGRKMLPIWQDDEGYMGESLDILHKIDRMQGARLFDGPESAAITGWITAWKPVIWDLVLPRVADPRFPEFRSAQARAAFTAAKEQRHGSFPALRAGTDRLLAELAEGLAALEPLLPDPARAGLDDILLFPVLRTLAVVEGLSLPPRVSAYCAEILHRSGIIWPGALPPLTPAEARS